jgi:carbonic anhydrase
MRLFLACLAATLLAICQPAMAGDSHAAPAAAVAASSSVPSAVVAGRAVPAIGTSANAGPTSVAPASLVPTIAPGGAGRAASSARRGFEDPMERLRARLAEKLAGGGQIDTSSPGVVHVVNRGGSAEPASPASPATRAGAAPVAGRQPPAPVEHPRRAGAPPEVHLAHWGYQGPGGPSHWAQLKPEFAICGSGTRQSPIDIRDGIKVQLDPVRFDYHPSSFRVVDNGHTVQVDVGPGNAIEVLGRRYELVQFHFHRPSEERIEGRQFPMVAHLVHKSDDGRLAVVAVLIEQGHAHPVVQAVWNNLPLDQGEDVAALASLELGALLPEDRAYFTYMGSLTTPPCSEGVLWMVMRQPVQVSPEQIGVFARLYPMNARPIQQAGGRLIKESD